MHEVNSITAQIRSAVMQVEGVKEITQIRVFGPGRSERRELRAEPYSVDLHIMCKEFTSFCEVRIGRCGDG